MTRGVKASLQQRHRGQLVGHSYGTSSLTGVTALRSDGSKCNNIVFFGETGAGKSSTINLLLESGPTAPVSNDSRPCTKASTSYETTLKGRKYNLWDTRGLGNGILKNIFRGSPETNLKKLLKERHSIREIDLLVYCVRGSRATEASVKYYKNFCDITRRLAAPVAIVVTHLERVGMEDWWNQNSSELEELGMVFDDHACVTALPVHPLRAESKKKLVDLITEDRRWEAKEFGSYFGSSAIQGSPRAPSARRTWFSRINEGLGGRWSNRPRPRSRVPSSSTKSSYHTPPSSPAESMPSSPIVDPGTPSTAAPSVIVPPINTNLLQTGDRPQPSSEETFSSTGDSMFHHSTETGYTSHSEVCLELCTEENEEHFKELPFRFLPDSVRRKRSWANSSGAFGDVWECNLISGKSSRLVAVKAVRTNINDPGDARCREKKLRRELKIWVGLQHKNIVPLLGVVPGFGPFPSMVSPWYRNGSLSSYLLDHQLSSARKHHLLGDIAAGLQYLHGEGVVHADVHSGNVLIDDEGTARITDFGLSFIIDFVGTSYLTSSICGGVRFADPALVQRVSSSHDNVFYPAKPCDIYSFGGLMLHVLSGKIPYDGICSHSIYMAVLNGERPKIPTHNHITRWHKKLIQQCWDREESKRPSADSLVSLRVFHRQSPP